MSQNGKSFVCPIDKRQFATKKALAQHRAASHNGSTPKPQSRGGGGSSRTSRVSKRNSSERGRSVSGSDIIGTFQIAATSVAGQVVMAGPVGPLQFEATRLAAESALWTRWRPMVLRIEFISSAGAMTSGSLVAGWTADPDLWLKDDITSISTVASFRPSQQNHISKRFVISLPCDPTRAWYLLDDKADLIDTSHGKYFAVLAANIGNVTGSSTFTYTVRLHYTIMFETPSLPSVVSDSSVFVYADAGYESYFTDSDGGWAGGKICTLKHSAGGSMCEFSNLIEGAIYQLDPNAILYAPTATGKTRIRYLMRIFGQSKHVIIFADILSARSYRKSKDPARGGVPYVSTGSSIVPSNPAWTLVEHPSKLKDDLERKVDQLTSLVTRLLAPSVVSSALNVSDAEVAQSTANTFVCGKQQLDELTSFVRRFEACSEVAFGEGVVNVALPVPVLSEDASSEASGWDMGK